MVKKLFMHKSKTWLETRRAQRKTIAQMAEEAGVSERSIADNMKKYGIK